jgi:hypothetical protein
MHQQREHQVCLWLHKTRKISFTLVVDHFGLGVKYIDKTDALHLIKALEIHYTLKIDYSRDLCLDVTARIESEYIALLCVNKINVYIMF